MVCMVTKILSTIVLLVSSCVFTVSACSAEKRSELLQSSELTCEKKDTAQESSVWRESACPREMVEISGEYCTSVVHVCKKWISERRDRCAEYYETSKCVGKRERKHFCIDRYEASNSLGDTVPRGYTWYGAKNACESQGKRLCLSNEWTFACEGERATPYSYGYKRSSETCNIDKRYTQPNNTAWLKDRNSELARLDQSEYSGYRTDCHSSFGVYDMDGSVDEWTYDPTGIEGGGSGKEKHYKSALKGGYWSTVRNRCRPVTATHNEYHSWYQTTFRCCKDV